MSAVTRQQCAGYTVGSLGISIFSAFSSTLGAVTFTAVKPALGGIYGGIFGLIFSISYIILSRAFMLDPAKGNWGPLIISSVISTFASFGFMHLIGMPIVIGTAAILASAALVGLIAVGIFS